MNEEMKNKGIFDSMLEDGWAIGITRKIGKDGRDLYTFVPEKDGLDCGRVKNLSVRVFNLINEWESEFRKNKNE